MANLLIVHENPTILNDLRTSLEKGGHWVLSTESYNEALDRMISHTPHVTLIGHKSLDGPAPMAIHHLKHIVKNRPVPIVLIGTRSALHGLLPAFGSLGPDGTLHEEDIPSLDIIRTINGLLNKPHIKKSSSRYLHYGSLELDRLTRTARLGNAHVQKIPKRLFDLLWLLSKRSKLISDRQLIISKSWGTRVREREVDVIISRLKARVPFIASFLMTIPDKGYILHPPSLIPSHR